MIDSEFFSFRLHSRTRNRRRKLVRIPLRSSMAVELTVIWLRLELGAAALGRLRLLLRKVLNQVNFLFLFLFSLCMIWQRHLKKLDGGDLNLVCDLLKDPTVEDRGRRHQPHREIMCSGTTPRGLIPRRFIISLISPSLSMGIP